MKNKRVLPILPPFEATATKRVLQVNPTIAPARNGRAKTVISIFEYDVNDVKVAKIDRIEDTYSCINNTKVSWINFDGITKADVENVGNHFGIHPLIQEDILSIGQRPKMDDLNQLLYCLLNMLYFNEEASTVETEQVSIVLGPNFVLSFQEDAARDVFNPVREKIKVAGSKLRLSKSDYLFYSLIDMIVDNYFVVMEKLGEKIEGLEEDITHYPRYANTCQN